MNTDNKKKRIVELLCAVPGTESYDEKKNAAIAAGMTQLDYIRAHALLRTGGIGLVMLEETNSSTSEYEAAAAPQTDKRRGTGTKLVLEATADKLVFQVRRKGKSDRIAAPATARRNGPGFETEVSIFTLASTALVALVVYAYRIGVIAEAWKFIRDLLS